MKDNLNTWLDLYYVFLPYSKTHQTEITSHIIGTVIRLTFSPRVDK